MELLNCVQFANLNFEENMKSFLATRKDYVIAGPLQHAMYIVHKEDLLLILRKL